MGDFAPEASRTRRLSGPVGWTLITTSIGFVIVQLDITIANVALPQIAVEFSIGTSELQWIIDAYSLAFATLLLTAGVAGSVRESADISDRLCSVRMRVSRMWSCVFSIDVDRRSGDPRGRRGIDFADFAGPDCARE